MEIILVEEMPNLGEVGDIVSVKGMHGIIFFPRGIAILQMNGRSDALHTTVSS